MIEISPDSQRFLERLVAAGQFTTREEAIDEAIRRLRADLETDGSEAIKQLSGPEWCRWFEEWAASHRPLRHEADDSRESIYLGRDE